MWRLIKLNTERDDKPVSKKFRLVMIPVTILLVIPPIRRAFRSAVIFADWNNLIPDEIDRFWMCYRIDYKFFGKSNEERRQMINHLRVAKPVKVVADVNKEMVE
jgi:hypothetical protein